MRHFMLAYAPWAAAALVAVAVANLVRVALRNDRRRPRYGLDVSPDLDTIIKRSQNGEGRQ